MLLDKAEWICCTLETVQKRQREGVEDDYYPKIDQKALDT